MWLTRRSGLIYARMRRLLWMSLLLAACGTEEGSGPPRVEPPPPPSASQNEAASNEPASNEPRAASIGRAPASEAEQQAVAQARAAAQHLGQTLRGRLMAAMAEGPEAAVRVCADEAQALTAQAAAERGARVGRTSSRLRNPANQGPEWPRAWLAHQGERPAAQVTPSTGIAEGDPAAARFVAPIAIEGPCLLCHGPAEGIPQDVQAILRERYPGDRATGYRVGDLRGALWAEVEIAP